jgi:myo-inositol-1(or 4)-monophosphatase
MTNLEAAVAAAREAGEFARQGFGHPGKTSFKSANAGDMVTRFDTGAEEIVARSLAAHDPSIDFVGEENGGKHTDRFWIVDPIDGTGYFARGIPHCTTMIALIESGEPTLSVIYNFVTGELYTAEKGKGAFLDGAPIRVSDRPLAQSYIGVETNLEKPVVAEAFAALAPKIVWLHTISCGYEFGKIAEGKLDGRVQINPFGRDHDFAPCGLLVAEAGGVVRNFGSDSYDFRNHNFIAANPRVYEELMSDAALVRSLEAAAGR